jgi:hypothetical protein
MMRDESQRYIPPTQPVSDDKHCGAIRRISDNLSARFEEILKGGRLRYGTSQKAFNLFDYGVGVSTANTYVVKRIDSDFFSEEDEPLGWPTSRGNSVTETLKISQRADFNLRGWSLVDDFIETCPGGDGASFRHWCLQAYFFGYCPNHSGTQTHQNRIERILPEGLNIQPECIGRRR